MSLPSKSKLDCTFFAAPAEEAAALSVTASDWPACIKTGSRLAFLSAFDVVFCRFGFGLSCWASAFSSARRRKPSVTRWLITLKKCGTTPIPVQSRFDSAEAQRNATVPRAAAMLPINWRTERLSGKFISANRGIRAVTT